MRIIAGFLTLGIPIVDLIKEIPVLAILSYSLVRACLLKSIYNETSRLNRNCCTLSPNRAL